MHSRNATDPHTDIRGGNAAQLILPQCSHLHFGVQIFPISCSDCVVYQRGTREGVTSKKQGKDVIPQPSPIQWDLLLCNRTSRGFNIFFLLPFLLVLFSVLYCQRQNLHLFWFYTSIFQIFLHFLRDQRLFPCCYPLLAM